MSNFPFHHKSWKTVPAPVRIFLLDGEESGVVTFLNNDVSEGGAVSACKDVAGPTDGSYFGGKRFAELAFGNPGAVEDEAFGFYA